ncbi:small-conductance mechanosensitive channel MscS [Candidatus Hoaglandella endobia]|uniref:Small-conductance mechanosensitive channel n=1 Tax=Candidatus Hoaglandella endobia TaxID=1778263 RepID=A0A143WRP9_9ENTR|nr:small-conductance mechanosensitive channel MscS [Candidatus Hoaglandella endobia]CUX96380.1 Small-conductance mechanosensitive channel [Candidatus Hoaglandella endobia]
MEDLNVNVVDGINGAGTWLVKNQGLFIQYAVNIVTAIVILLIGSIVARMIGNALNRVIKLRGIDATVADFLSAIVRYVLRAFTLIAVLGSLGVQTSSVIAVLGAAGLAVALSLQGSLSNFAAGVLLVIFRPLRLGEYVDLCGVIGIVDQVHIFTTTLRTPDNKTIVVPNGKIIAGNIINYSREPNRRVDIEIGVAYHADIDMVKKVLGDVIAADKRIIHEKGVTVRLKDMAPSSLNFITRSWTANAEYWNVYFDLMENFKRALDANKIGMPFPQMDVHLYQPDDLSNKAE